MASTDGLRSEAMIAAFNEAIAGRPERLYVQLGTASGLPGTRMNLPTAQAFANECLARGAPADRLVLAMAQLSADAAPGASELEFLPVCGLLALGARAASDGGDANANAKPGQAKRERAFREQAVRILHSAADDLRFRVREIVPVSLAKIGGRMGDPLVHELASWMDGFFHATAAILAMAQPEFLARIDDVDAALARLDEAYALARDAPRSAARYPGRKALVEALGSAPAAIATRFGVPVFDRLVAWAKTEMPELRDAIERVLRSEKIASRYAPEAARVRAALTASLPPPRDPTLAVQGMRGRGKKRARR